MPSSSPRGWHQILGKAPDPESQTKDGGVQGPAWAAGLNKVSESRAWGRDRGLAEGFAKIGASYSDKIPIPAIADPNTVLACAGAYFSLHAFLPSHIYLNFFIIIIIVYFVCECGHTCAILWMPEGNFWETILSSLHGF